MTDKLEQFLKNLGPFIIIGVGASLLISLLFLFSYFLFWGLIIGTTLWAISTAKAYFFPSQPEQKPRKHRIIEHDDKNTDY